MRPDHLNGLFMSQDTVESTGGFDVNDAFGVMSQTEINTLHGVL
jgi:hypothetical protein